MMSKKKFMTRRNLSVALASYAKLGFCNYGSAVNQNIQSLKLGHFRVYVSFNFQTCVNWFVKCRQIKTSILENQYLVQLSSRSLCGWAMAGRDTLKRSSHKGHNSKAAQHLVPGSKSPNSTICLLSHSKFYIKSYTFPAQIMTLVRPFLFNRLNIN